MTFPENAADPELIGRARAGDRAAIESLYRDFAKPVFHLAYRLLMQRELAEEVMQDVFVDLAEKLAGFRGDAPFGAWLRRIAVNRSLSLLRSPWLRLRGNLDAVPEPVVARNDHPEELADLRRIEAALSKLKPPARAVLWLHDVEGYTHREIAAAMGRTPSYSKSQLARAHERLRQLLDGNQLQEAPACMPAQNPC